MTITQLTAKRRLKIRAENFNYDQSRISKNDVYNKLKSISPRNNYKPTQQTMDQSLKIFNEHPEFTLGYLLDVREQILTEFINTGKYAHLRNGVVQSSHSKTQDNYRIRMQIENILVEKGYFIRHLSPKGSPKMTRLIPTAKIAALTPKDLKATIPTDPKSFVKVTKRDEKKTVFDFDLNDPVAIESQQKLELINQVNSQFTILHGVIDEYQELDGTKQLLPIHIRIFKKDDEIENPFELYGRLHTDKFGHQSLHSSERSLITFDDQGSIESSVELDYKAMHPRMLYHLIGMEYQNDPYILWDETTPEMRTIAKLMLNTAINANNRLDAISTCRLTSLPFNTKSRKKKTGKRLKDARKISHALEITGLKLEEVYDQTVLFHEPISEFINSDHGVKLMRIESDIVLDSMHLLAKQGIPSLSVHDSIVVPRSAWKKLYLLMKNLYFEKLKFYPQIKVPDEYEELIAKLEI